MLPARLATYDWSAVTPHFEDPLRRKEWEAVVGGRPLEDLVGGVLDALDIFPPAYGLAFFGLPNSWVPWRRYSEFGLVYPWQRARAARFRGRHRRSLGAAHRSAVGASPARVAVLAPYFDTAGASNGPTEAMNLLIDKIPRLGHGFRNYDNYPGCDYCATAESSGRLIPSHGSADAVHARWGRACHRLHSRSWANMCAGTCPAVPTSRVTPAGSAC